MIEQRRQCAAASQLFGQRQYGFSGSHVSAGLACHNQDGWQFVGIQSGRGDGAGLGGDQGCNDCTLLAAATVKQANLQLLCAVLLADALQQLKQFAVAGEAAAPIG